MEIQDRKLGNEIFLIVFKGQKVRIEGTSVLGEDVEIKDEVYLNGNIIFPHKSVSQSIDTKGTIIM